MREFDFCSEAARIASVEKVESFDFNLNECLIRINGNVSFSFILNMEDLIKQKEKNDNRRYKNFVIPDYVLGLPDNALLNSSEIMSMFGYSGSTSASTMIEKGRVPAPDVKIRKQRNGSFILNWSVGYIKRLSSQ